MKCSIFSWPYEFAPHEFKTFACFFFHICCFKLFLLSYISHRYLLTVKILVSQVKNNFIQIVAFPYEIFFLLMMFFMLLKSHLPIFSLMVCLLLLRDTIQPVEFVFFLVYIPAFNAFALFSILTMTSMVIITNKCVSFLSYYFVSCLTHEWD